MVRDLVEAARILAEKSQEESFKASVESLSRVFNLAEKAESRDVDESRFENEQEKALYQAVEDLHFTEEIEDNVDQLFGLSAVINDFFDHTMVMAEDENLRQNRLALLAQLRDKARRLAQFNQMNTK